MKGEILDTTVLLRTCVQSAVGMLRDQNEDLSRSTRRIKILLGLLSKENDLKGTCSLAAAGAALGTQGTRNTRTFTQRCAKAQRSLLWCSQGGSPRRFPQSMCLCPRLSLLWLQGLSWSSGCSSSGGGGGVGFGLVSLFVCSTSWLIIETIVKCCYWCDTWIWIQRQQKKQVPCCFLASFLKITKARLSNLLKKQEENSLYPKNWVLREASNLSALQEAGTFR